MSNGVPQIKLWNYTKKNTFSSFCRKFWQSMDEVERDKELQHRLSSWNMLSKFKNLPGIHLKVSLQRQKLSDPWSLYVIRNGVNWPNWDSLQQLLIFQDVRSRLPHTVYLFCTVFFLRHSYLHVEYEKK
jgi:hypothetical protein